jgi:hypothetical protein
VPLRIVSNWMYPYLYQKFDFIAISRWFHPVGESEGPPTLKLRRVNSRRKAPERKQQTKKDSHQAFPLK